MTTRHLEATRDDRARRLARPRAVARERHRHGRLRRQRASTRRSRPRRPGSACRSPSASPRTYPASPGASRNAQVVVTPDGEITSRYDKVRRVPFGEYVPLRGLLEALGAPVDQVPHGRHRRHGPAVLDLPDGDPARRRDLVGGVLRRPGARRRRARRRASSSTRPTAPATPARSCRPSRSRRAGCGRSRPDGGWSRPRPPASPRSSRPTAR